EIHGDLIFLELGRFKRGTYERI
ncbi:hypothetical protein Q604_UNBC14108G0001, partial [human gut metagenome]